MEVMLLKQSAIHLGSSIILIKNCIPVCKDRVPYLLKLEDENIQINRKSYLDEELNVSILNVNTIAQLERCKANNLVTLIMFEIVSLASNEACLANNLWQNTHHQLLNETNKPRQIGRTPKFKTLDFTTAISKFNFNCDHFTSKIFSGVSLL